MGQNICRQKGEYWNEKDQMFINLPTKVTLILIKHSQPEEMGFLPLSRQGF